MSAFFHILSKSLYSKHCNIQGYMICGEENQLDATQWFIKLINHSKFFGHYYAHLQKLKTMQMVRACGTEHFVCSWSVVWNGAVGYVSRWRDVATSLHLYSLQLLKVGIIVPEKF
jgi:hypothetical protein